jgi:hypothetical protein
VICYVDHHDAAYEWAKRRKLDVHEMTGAARFDVLDKRVVEVAKRITTVQPAVTPEDQGSQRPFEHLNDATLLAYGVPRNWLNVVWAASVDTFLEIIAVNLPAEAGDHLLTVATGGTPVVAQKPSVRDPFAHPDARRRFHVLSADADALRQALSAPWDAWQLFLHSSQRDAVERDHAGPARVTGRPGTQVEQLLAELPDAHARIDDAHLHQRVVDMWREGSGHVIHIAKDDDLMRAIQHAFAQCDLGFTPEFVAAEWAMVVEPHGIRTWEEYARVDRDARGVPLQRSQRQRLWPVFEAVRTQLATAGLDTWFDLCLQVADALDRSGQPARYAHVVADEVQDFGPAELALVRALAAEGANNAFLAGDAHQRICKPRISFVRLAPIPFTLG